MSYPQPKATEAILKGNDFFRLKTSLISDGDIYEATVGATAFALGPDSDISRVVVGYYDIQTATFLEKVTITPGRVFSGSLFANNVAAYQPSNRPGKILMWAEERFNPLAQGIFPNDQRVDITPPILDVIMYTSPAQNVQPMRADKTYFYQRLPSDGEAEYLLFIPYYGRRYANVKITNVPGNLSVLGWTYSQTQTGVLDQIIKLASLSPIVNPPITTQLVFTAGRHGLHDMLVLGFTGDLTNGESSVSVVVSDSESAYVAPPEP